MFIKNVLDTALWVPADIKVPKFSQQDVEAAPALAGTMETVWGKLEPGEEVVALDDAVKAFARIAGDRVSVRGGN